MKQSCAHADTIGWNGECVTAPLNLEAEIGKILYSVNRGQSLLTVVSPVFFHRQESNLFQVDTQMF